MNGMIPSALRLVDGQAEVAWLRPDGQRFTEPFFHDSLRRLRRSPQNRGQPPCFRPADELASLAPGVAPAAFIFHTSRCGSTLIAQMLAALPRNIVIAEPPVLDDILRARRDQPTLAPERSLAWFRGAVHAFGRTGDATQDRLFVKLDSWHIFDMPFVQQAFPGVPLLFVHRHPLEILVSLSRRPSLTLVRGTVSPEQIGLPFEDMISLPPEEYAAAILGAFFRTARQHRDRLLPVAYEELPAFVWEKMPGGPFDQTETEALRRASARNAKDPAQIFTADSAEKRQAASPGLVAACQTWVEPAYRSWCEAVTPALSANVAGARPQSEAGRAEGVTV